jgi:hypothetical protein
MSEPLVPPSLLFEFAIEIRQFATAKSKKTLTTPTKKKASTAIAVGIRDWQLGERFLLPDFNALTGKPKQGTVAVAWSDEGLYFESEIRGKRQLPSFTQENGGVSDGLRVWIDTRNSPNVHRATRFCHCFHFFPGNPNPDIQAPHGILDDVARARDNPLPIDKKQLQVRSQFTRFDYRLMAFIPANCLTGYQPSEFDRLRLFYDLVDNELGTQSQALGPELRYNEDPSLWIEAKLIR